MKISVDSIPVETLRSDYLTHCLVNENRTMVLNCVIIYGPIVPRISMYRAHLLLAHVQLWRSVFDRRFLFYLTIHGK